MYDIYIIYIYIFIYIYTHIHISIYIHIHIYIVPCYIYIHTHVACVKILYHVRVGSAIVAGSPIPRLPRIIQDGPPPFYGCLKIGYLLVGGIPTKI